MTMKDLSSKLLVSKPEVSLPLSLSVSKVKTFKDCKAKFRYCYIEKLPRKEWEFHVFGKFLHEVLENFYKRIILGNQDPPNVLMTSCFKDSYKNWKDKLNQNQIKESKEILTKHLFKYGAGTDPSLPTILDVEKEFYIDIDGKILLNGFIDRVQRDPDGMIHVSDYKTTKHKKYLKNDFFQLMTYAFVMCLEDPSLKRVRASYIMLRHDFDSIVKEFTRDEILSIEETFLDYAKKIDQEKLYRPSPSRLCSFCDYLNVCTAGQQLVGEPEENLTKFGASSW